MTVKTAAQIKADSDTLLPDNASKRITPQRVRERFKDLADSAHFPVDPRFFGAKVDGVTDDTEAANACAEYCVTTGADFVFPRGKMRVTGPIKFGLSRYTSLGWALNRTGRLDANEEAAALSAANVAANVAGRRPCNIRCESGSVVVADFLPADSTPVVELNLNSRGEKGNLFGSLTIVTPAYILPNGRVDRYLSGIPADNKLIGFAVYLDGLKQVGPISAIGMGAAGVLGIRNYWTEFTGITGWGCGDVANLADANAASANVEGWHSKRGLVMDGAAFYGRVHTEQVRTDLRVLFAETSTFVGGYLEENDFGYVDGEGAYAVDLGGDAEVSHQVILCNFINLRVGSVRLGKKAYRLHGVNSCTFSACREYGHGVEADSVSQAFFINCDFMVDEVALPLARFGRNYGAAIEGPIKFNGAAQIQRKDIIRVNSFNYGTIPADGSIFKDLTIPEIKVAYSGSTATVTQASAGDPKAVLSARLTSATNLRVYIVNPTSSAMAFAAVLDVELTLYLAETSVMPSMN